MELFQIFFDTSYIEPYTLSCAVNILHQYILSPVFYKLLDIVFNPENIPEHFPPSGYLDFSLLWYLNPNQMISECFMRYVRLGTNPVFHQKTQDVMPESGRWTLQLKASKCWTSLLLLPLAVLSKTLGPTPSPKILIGLCGAEYDMDIFRNFYMFLICYLV